MTILRSFRCGFAVLVALGTWPCVATATDDSVKAAVRELSSQGKDDFDAGRFDGAAQKFQKAFEAAKVPTLALWSARSLARLGRLVAASEYYRQATQLSPNDLWQGNAQQEAQVEAQAELDALLPRIPKLRIQVVGGLPAEVALTVDNVVVPPALVGIDRPSEPGIRRVIGKRGAETADVSVELRERDIKEVILKFSGAPLGPPPPVAPIGPVPSYPPANPAVAPTNQPYGVMAPPNQPPPTADQGSDPGSTQRTLGWIGLGIGAAGVIEGAVTGIFVVQRYAKLKNDCVNNVCDPTRIDSYRMDMYNTLRAASMVGFIVGGVGIATGTTLLLTSPSKDSKVGLYVAPSHAGFHGVF
jgi:hypothetical protein